MDFLFDFVINELYLKIYKPIKLKLDIHLQMRLYKKIMCFYIVFME